MKVQFPDGTKAVPLSDLVPYARNARTHDEAQVRQIAGSIVRFGFNNPVLVDPEMNIIAGHGRVLAAESLGLPEVPVLVLGHLSDTERKAYILADNQIALNAGWDMETLSHELASIRMAGGDLDTLGFDDQHVEDLLSGLDDPASFLNDMASPAPPPALTDPGSGAGGSGGAAGLDNGTGAGPAPSESGGKDQGGTASAPAANAHGGVALVLTMTPEDRDAVVAWLGRERDARGLRTTAEALAALAGENME